MQEGMQVEGRVGLRAKRRSAADPGVMAQCEHTFGGLVLPFEPSLLLDEPV